MSLVTVMLLVLLLILVGILPVWPYSKKWGYYPSIILFIVIIILLVLSYTGYI